MLKPIIRLLAFFTKEINEVRRQPRLVLSLVFGPFLILLLFGIGYQGDRFRPRVALVVPPGLASTVKIEDVANAINANFQLVNTGADTQAAMNMLNSRQVDLVEIIPADVEKNLELGAPSGVEFHYAEINPLSDARIRYLGYAQVTEMNKALLVQTTAQLQQEASANKEWVSQARNGLDHLSGNLTPEELAKQQETIRRLRQLVVAAGASPALASQVSNDGEDFPNSQQELQKLAVDLGALDQAITNHTLDQETNRIQSTREGLDRFEQQLTTFSQISPQVIVSPLQPQYSNEGGGTLDYMTFYAPAVLALLIQHIAVTLAALSLVRERLLGAVEIFRVTPVSTMQVLLGKYLAYILFLAILTAVLVVGMLALHVPFLGRPILFAEMMLLLIIGALGIGFVISTVSKSDTQAVQFSMLVLLVSIFFSGLFLPLENFWPPVRIIGYLLPITPAIVGLQDIVLRGRVPELWTWVDLAAIAATTFLIVSVRAKRQFRILAAA